MIVNRLKRVEEADRVLLGERDPALVGKHVRRPTGGGSPEEVAQRFPDRGGRRLVDRSLLIGQQKFKSLSAHDRQCTDTVRSLQGAVSL